MTSDKLSDFHWYGIVGYEFSDADKKIVCRIHQDYVQATSRHEAQKTRNGSHWIVDADGHQCRVFYPTHDHEVETLPSDWTPAAVAGVSGDGLPVIVQVWPATQYVCGHCGKTRWSQRHYAHVWCDCSHQAFPVPNSTRVAPLNESLEPPLAAVETLAHAATEEPHNRSTISPASHHIRD